jgi:predicted RNA-binding Zn ribbon-like protein
MNLEGYTRFMSGTPEGQTLFDLCGGHAALDLVNSLDNRFREDGPNEMLASYGDVLRFLEESGMLSRQRARALSKAVAPAAAESALRSVRELREATAAALYASLDRKPPAAQDVRVLEKYFLDAGRHRELRWETDPGRRPGLAWQWGRFETQPEVPLWILSEAVADILLSDKGTHVRACNVDTCRWLFLDTSKNHTRRWCNMRVCGNRMKARRFQQARRES